MIANEQIYIGGWVAITNLWSAKQTTRSDRRLRHLKQLAMVTDEWICAHWLSSDHRSLKCQVNDEIGDGEGDLGLEFEWEGDERKVQAS